MAEVSLAKAPDTGPFAPPEPQPAAPLPPQFGSFDANVDPLRRTLVTPEGVDLKLRLASGGARFGALMLDLLLILGGLIGLTLLILALAYVSGGGGAFVQEMLQVLWVLGWFVIRSGYFILMELSGRGATLGKRALGIRVIARSGERLSAEAVVARNLMRDIEVFLPLGLFFQGLFQALLTYQDTTHLWFAFIWVMIFALFPLFNRDRLRVGDLLAGTWVVEVPKRRLSSDLVDATPAQDAIQFTPEQLDAYGVYELQTLEGVLRLDQPDTLKLVAGTIRQKIGFWGPGEDWDFLNAYYAAARARMERGLLFGKRRANKFDRDGKSA